MYITLCSCGLCIRISVAPGQTDGIGPVIRVFAILDIAELVPSFPSGVFWKFLEAAPGAAPKHYKSTFIILQSCQE